MTENSTRLDRVFTVSVNAIIDVLSVLTLALLICATGLLAYELYTAIVDWEPGKLRHVAIDIFTVFVFIEVAQLFRHFRHGEGLVLREVIEISFLVVMREFIVKNVEEIAAPLEMLGFAAVLAALSLAWWLTRGTRPRAKIEPS